MPEEQTQDQFLKDLEVDSAQDPFAALEEPTADTQPEPEEDTEEKATNRRERRLREKYQAERETSIALAARLEALTEAQKFSRAQETSSFEEKAKRIYGTDTPENAAATELLIAAIKEAKESAKQEALDAFREIQAQERESVRKEEGALDSMLEDLEDTYNVDLTSKGAEATRKAFFQKLEKLSPKDSEGNITQYADPHAVWEEMQSKKTQTSTRAKDLASRSMVRTGASPKTTVQEDSTLRFLKENGLI